MRVQAHFYQSSGYPFTQLFLRWSLNHYIVEGRAPSGGFIRSCTLKAQLDHSRRGHSGSQDLIRALDAAIISEFASLDNALSPESLTQDGEVPMHEVEIARRVLMAKVNDLVAAWGRIPTMNEVYGSGGDYPLSEGW